MSKVHLNNIISKYLDAKIFITNRGYSDEIDWQDNLYLENIFESTFLREAAWVVLSSGMRETVIRKVFPIVSSAFFNWESASIIVENKDYCLSAALNSFGHLGKIKALVHISEMVNEIGFGTVLSRIKKDKLDFIQTFPFMGPATAYHFGKNIGLNVAKPDRHLLRIASTLGYDCPHKLCADIAKLTDDKLSVIDLVLWRYAVTDKNYINFFSC